MELTYLEDKWEEENVHDMDQPEMLRYRSNLIGSDLRITNFGGGNTSSKVMQEDPLTDETVEVMWVKGSGSNLATIDRDGFARLYMKKFRGLRDKYRGKEHEDEMVDYYPLCQFGTHDRPPSIDTPLHGILPHKHIDHTHPDWAIALAAAANGKKKMEEFNDEFDYNLIWLPWERPGYHLATMLDDALEEQPDADGVILACHGLITWGNEQYECYRNTLETIDALGQFVKSHVDEQELFGGRVTSARDDREDIASDLLPFVRGLAGEENPVVGHYIDKPRVLRFVNSDQADELAYHGTSCPDHFVRTKVRPMFVDWDPETDSADDLKKGIEDGVESYRADYRRYYEENSEEDTYPMMDPNPRVVLIPGIGMFSFGKNKKEARITGEFYVNAIGVMEGATSMEGEGVDPDLNSDDIVHNYVSLPESEAFRIEYWDLEIAKLKRRPPEEEMARTVAFVAGGGSGIGEEICHQLLASDGHVIVADLDQEGAEETVSQLQDQYGDDRASSVAVDISDQTSVRRAMREAVLEFGGLDLLVNTAAFYPFDEEGNESYSEETWDRSMDVNVHGNVLLMDAFADVIEKQESEGAAVLTSSANAVVPKSGSEPYDVSKAATNHLIRELAIRYAPDIRVNGISPATVMDNSNMFPRERVISRLEKYDIPYEESEETEALISKLQDFYAERTLTEKSVPGESVARAGYYLLSEKFNRTTGHIFPVDAGLREAFLR